MMRCDDIPSTCACGPQPEAMGSRGRQREPVISVLATCHFLYFSRSSKTPKQLIEPLKSANCVHKGGRVPQIKAKRHPIFPGPETYHIGGVVISIDLLYLVRYRRSRCRWFSRCRRRRGRRAVFKSKAEKVMKQIRVRDKPPSVHRQDLPSASRALSLATLPTATLEIFRPLWPDILCCQFC